MSAVGGALRRCPAHGTDSTVTVDDMYKRAARMARKRRELLNAQGIRTRVDAGPAVEHLRELTAMGATQDAIARVGGCSITTVRNIMAGRQKQISLDNETKILRVQWSEELADTHGASAVGPRRRVQGLIAMGHPLSRIAAEASVSRDTLTNLVHGDARTVWPATAQRIEAATRRMARRPGGNTEAMRRARQYGWVSLAAWDDIDDPKARASTGPKRVPNGGRSRQIVDDTAALIAQRLPREEIARRLGIQWKSIQKAHARCGVSLMGVIR